MSQTIVGLFDSISDAQRASDRLAQDGIARADMHVHAQDDRSGADISGDTLGNPATARTVAADTGEGGQHEGGIAHFSKACSEMTTHRKKSVTIANPFAAATRCSAWR
jgi:hypothetical protein